MNEEINIDINNPGTTIYVNQNATGNGDGSSWENAYTDLQPALRASQPNDEVWVAQGTYFPTDDEDRSQSFVIKDRVKVYGGFAGGETDLSQRDLLANPVTLSGNIGNLEDAEDNSSRVVDISNTSSFFTVFDGFRIVDGYNDSISAPVFGGGAGIYGMEGDADLSNLILANNTVTNGDGGAIYVSSSNLSLNNVVFIGNFAGTKGGAISTFVSEGEINNALFIGNQSETGGAIHFSLAGDGFNLNNNTFYNNQAASGAVISMPSAFNPVNIRNSIFRENIAGDDVQFVDPDDELRINNSIVQNGFEGSGEGIIDADPLFADPDNLNFSLQQSSPGIDAGDNNAIEGIDTDLVGNSRITNDTVDLGAYELVLTTDDIDQNPDTPPENGDSDGVVAEGDPVYRFFIPDTGVHFYTAEEEERDEILETEPDYVLEGTPYNSAPADDSLTGVAPIYRFLNTDTGVRIYTISEVERDSIETLSNYESEGIAYYGYTEQLEDTTPVFRFYNPTIDAHFYTSSTVERDSVIENLPNYELESNGGIAFYVEPIFTSETPTDGFSASEFGDVLTGISQVIG